VCVLHIRFTIELVVVTKINISYLYT